MADTASQSKTTRSVVSEDLPLVPGWISLTEAAERLGHTRQHGHRMAVQGKFRSLSRVGTSHVVLVATDEIEDMILRRAQRDAPPE